MKTLNTKELNEVMARGLKIIKKFSINHVTRDEDFNNLYDYLMNESMNYYYKLLDDDENEVNEKTIINCFFHSINVLKLRHGVLNYANNNDNSVSEINLIGGGVDNGKYNRVIKSKYKIDRYNNISFQSIANTYTNKSLRNAVEHGCFYVSIDDNEVLKNTLYSGLNPADELIKKEQASEVRKVLKNVFADSGYNRFFAILKSEKTASDTDRKYKNRFFAKYPFLRQLEKNELIYLFNTYSM